MSGSPTTATILVVGDMHRHWRAADRSFLEAGHQDLVLFVGDLGDEDLNLVRDVAAVRAAKAVMLGNHDAWQSFSNKKPTPRLTRSLEALGDDHLAYRVREISAGGVSVVGARPFSWGGPSLRSREVYQQLYGVEDMNGSAEKIVNAARDAHHRDLLILAHNGPAGLSVEPQDIYGKDFGKPGGDWGDADLELAVQKIKASGWRVPCVVAGHMHDRVMTPRGAPRERFVRKGSTLYVNPAVVPRVRPLACGTTVAHYVRMVWSAGALQSLEEIWVDPDGEIRELHEPRVREL